MYCLTKFNNKRFYVLASKFRDKKFSTNPKYLDITVSDGSIATVVLKRPPVNALNIDLLRQLKTTLLDLEKAKVRGMILTSNSDRIFSAGLDLNEVYKTERNTFLKFWRQLQDTWMCLYNSSFPTAALITGHAPAGGCLLAASCEYRVMVNDFTIGLNEVIVGIPVPPWLESVMSKIMGHRNAELALTSGKLFTSDEALKFGLLDEIAVNREDGQKKIEMFFNKFKNVYLAARSTTKRTQRKKAVEIMEMTRQQELDFMGNFVMEPEFQQHLEHFITSLKNKRT